MYVPSLLERVRLGTKGELYLVTRVDHDEQVASIAPVVYGGPALKAVPFASLEQVAGHVPPRLGPDR